MAQYATLKEYIEETIYENGTQAITGDLLQEVLLNMTDALGEYYQAGGVASPATDPGTPDAKVIYIATEPGNYTHFGGATLDVGEVALLIFTSSWEKVTLNILSSANGAVKTDNLADAAVTADKIAGGAVETAKIADGNVTSAKLADGAVSTGKIATGAITTEKVAAGAVTSGKIADGGVTTAKVADGAITPAKLEESYYTEEEVDTKFDEFGVEHPRPYVLDDKLIFADQAGVSVADEKIIVNY